MVLLFLLTCPSSARSHDCYTSPHQHVGGGLGSGWLRFGPQNSSLLTSPAVSHSP